MRQIRDSQKNFKYQKNSIERYTLHICTYAYAYSFSCIMKKLHTKWWWHYYVCSSIKLYIMYITNICRWFPELLDATKTSMISLFHEVLKSLVAPEVLVSWLPKSGQSALHALQGSPLIFFSFQTLSIFTKFPQIASDLVISNITGPNFNCDKVDRVWKQRIVMEENENLKLKCKLKCGN